MIHRSFSYLLLLSLGYLALSCAPKTSGIDLTRTSPEEIIQRVERNNHGVVTFRASGTISIESREFVGTGSVTVSLKRPDSVLIKIEGPFGIDVGSMLLTRERFTYYDSYSNRVITGSTTNRNIRSLLRVDLDFAEVMEFLSGTSSISRQGTPPDSISADDDALLLIFKKGSTWAQYWVDPEKFVVARYELRESETESILETNYERFSRFDGVFFPRTISVIAHRQRRGLTLHYDEIEINKPHLDLSLTIPQKAKRIYW